MQELNQIQPFGYDLFRSIQNVSAIVIVCNLFTITSQRIGAMQHTERIGLSCLIL